MPDLIAQGELPEHRWRRKLQPGQRHIIGREAGPWSTPWDERVSRRHIEISYEQGRLHVEALPSARNPIFFRGHKSKQFSLQPGDHFVIGKTTFSLVEERVNISLDAPQPADERTFTIAELRRRPFREAEKRIDVLTKLPEIISQSPTDQELVPRLVNLLLSGIERATAAAVVQIRGQGAGFGVQGSDQPGEELSDPNSQIQHPKSESIAVLHWDRRELAGQEFRPSERLIRKATTTEESIVQVWNATQTRGPGDFTVSEGFDWAFCTPVAGQACAGWALYVSGSFGSSLKGTAEPDGESLRDDVKFAELTASMLCALRESRHLAARQASLSQFFSPVVLETLSLQRAEEALAPREADVTVLFCDLRGFTEQSERSRGDLFGLLARVSQALGVMTHHILDQGGVVGDFHGDAAMGFWGWPIFQPDAIERACRAALNIRAAFADPARREGLDSSGVLLGTEAASRSGVTSGDRLANFRVGIGLASGRAVAGKIGTVDQVKVTVFGPVVNLASRLETMTKQLRAAILIDPPTAAVIRASVPREVCRVRRLARVRPVGLSTPLEVSELLPPLPLGEGRGEGTGLSDEHLTSYEAALDAFHARDWPLALKHLHDVPPDDVAKDFLTMFIVQHGRKPPANWDGAIQLEGK